MEKVDEKNGIICLVSMFSSRVMVLKLWKKVQFSQLYTHLNKKSKSIKATYINLQQFTKKNLSSKKFIVNALRAFITLSPRFVMLIKLSWTALLVSALSSLFATSRSMALSFSSTSMLESMSLSSILKTSLLVSLFT